MCMKFYLNWFYSFAVKVQMSIYNIKSGSKEFVLLMLWISNAMLCKIVWLHIISVTNKHLKHNTPLIRNTWLNV